MSGRARADMFRKSLTSPAQLPVVTAGSDAGALSIRRNDGTRVGAIVVTKYAAPATSSAGERPRPATASPPSTPPSGISDQQIAVLSDETRPSSGAGIRSRITA